MKKLIHKYIKKTQKRIGRVPDRFFWWQKIKHVLKDARFQEYVKNNSATNAWENVYIKSFLHHSHQNKLISLDFLKKIQKRKIFKEIFDKSKNILELGCGTGEFSHFIDKEYKDKKILGLEISGVSVTIANILYSNQNVNFLKIEPNEDLKKYGKFDIVICANVLEHFLNPYTLINKMFEVSPIVVILVPYDQPVIDKFVGEGMGGHIFRFTKESFKKYTILDSFVFESAGWDYSSIDEDPRQFAVMIKQSN
jgi:ubiquinone/menaquinone biosynthesis C-methylase UbiE